jgi:hypothetical protein
VKNQGNPEFIKISAWYVEAGLFAAVPTSGGGLSGEVIGIKSVERRIYPGNWVSCWPKKNAFPLID